MPGEIQTASEGLEARKTELGLKLNDQLTAERFAELAGDLGLDYEEICLAQGVTGRAALESLAEGEDPAKTGSGLWVDGLMVGILLERGRS